MGQKHGGGLESEGTIKGVKKYLNNEDASNDYNTHQMHIWDWKCYVFPNLAWNFFHRYNRRSNTHFCSLRLFQRRMQYVHKAMLHFQEVSGDSALVAEFFLMIKIIKSK